MGKINRLKELEKLLGRLRKDDTNGNSDIDLIFEYLEKFLNDPKIGGGSKKLMEFEIKNDEDTDSKIYHVVWRKPRILGMPNL